MKENSISTGFSIIAMKSKSNYYRRVFWSAWVKIGAQTVVDDLEFYLYYIEMEHLLRK